jgi:Domain of unknown function (DUF2382)
VVLREEEPVAEKTTVPRERVRLDTETVTDERQVTEEVRKEQIDLDDQGEGAGRAFRRAVSAAASVKRGIWMAQEKTVARSLHDLGLAAWFGGSLMGAVGLIGAAGAVDPAEQRLRVTNAGWARWTPVNLAGIAAHVAGGAMLLGANKGRLAGQRGVATATIAKTALTGLALAETGCSRALGAKLPQVRQVMTAIWSPSRRR